MISNCPEIRRELNDLVAVARGEGRSRDLFVYRTDMLDSPIAVGVGNPASEDVRGRLVAKMGERDRIACAILLRQLADAVSLATSSKKTSQASSRSVDTNEPPIEPWHSRVSTSDLLHEIQSLINKYVVLPAGSDVIVALWVLHTYLPEVSDYTPYLLITSPVRECGKSTLLDVLACLAFRAQLTGGITAAALYRRIDRLAPTILLDELDTRLRGDGAEFLRGVLNTGFHRSGKVTICVGDSNEDRDFRTFCPKALAGIGRPWDTVMSRSIPIQLARATGDGLSRLVKVRGDRINSECEPVRRRLLRWAADHNEALRGAEPIVPDFLGARQADVWRPLLGIADIAGPEWARRARDSAEQVHGSATDESDTALLLLEDLREVFQDHGNPTVLFSSTVVEELVRLEHRPWPEFRNGQPLSPTSVAKILGRFGVRPKPVREGTHESDPQRRGYKLSELSRVFETYLVPRSPRPIIVSHSSHLSHGSNIVTSELKLFERTYSREMQDVTDVTDVTAVPRAEDYGVSSMSPSDSGTLNSEYVRVERAALRSGL